MLWLSLLNRLYKSLKKLFQPLVQIIILNKYKLERWFYKTDWLKYSNGRTRRNLWYYSCPMLYILPDMSTNVTHFTKHMKKMIQAMDSPEVSVTSLLEMLTSSSWWKMVLIVIILIVLLELFAPCTCNCVMNLLPTIWKLLSYEWLYSLLRVPQTPPTIIWGPWIRDLNMRVRRICCLNRLGTIPFNSRK